MSTGSDRCAVAALLCVLLCTGCGAPQRPGQRWIHSFHLQGNRSLSTREIVGGLATQKTGWWPCADKQWVEPRVLDLDVQRIEAYYAAHGFFSAKVTKREVLPRKDGDSVNIRLTIEEGQPTIIEQIEFEKGGDRLVIQIRRQGRRRIAVAGQTRHGDGGGQLPID